MRNLIVLFTIVLSSFANAAMVTGARVNQEEKTLEVDVTYGGGCEEHFFDLKVGDICLESYPVQCSAEIVHTGKPDMCEAMISQTLKFSLEKYNLGGPMYLTITGAGDSSSRVFITE